MPQRRPRGRPRAFHDKTDQNTIQSLDRAMMILERLSASGGMTLSEIAGELDQSPATAYRVLTTLQTRGIVETDPAEQTWHVGAGAFRIGSAFLRRTKKEASDIVEFGGLRLDRAARRLMRGEEEIELSPKEFNLLDYFVEKQGRALTRDDILNAVWGYDCIVTSRSVDRFVTTLRNKIEPDPGNPVLIHTVRQVGYRFDPRQD